MPSSHVSGATVVVVVVVPGSGVVVVVPGSGVVVVPGVGPGTQMPLWQIPFCPAVSVQVVPSGRLTRHLPRLRVMQEEQGFLRLAAWTSDGCCFAAA